MAMADLVARLELDADNTIRSLESDADARVQALEADGQRLFAERLQQELGRRRETRLAALARDLAEAARTARARELEARRGLVTRLLARTRSLLEEAVDTEAYRRSLETRCLDALSYLEAVPCRIRCRPEDGELISALTADRCNVQVQRDGTVKTGLIVEALDGSVVIDQRLETQLDRLGDRLAMNLLAEEPSRE